MAGRRDYRDAIVGVLSPRQWVSISTIVAQLYMREGGTIVESEVENALDTLVEDGRVERDGTGSR